MGRFGNGRYPSKCFVCGAPHKRRGKHRYKELCKKCATKFMLKGRYLKMKLWCFGSLNCDEDFVCPLYQQCGKAVFDEKFAMPIEALQILNNKLENRKGPQLWKERTKK